MSKEKAGSTAEPRTRSREEIQEPPLFRVFLLNDDYTTMDFVVHVLETIFHKTPAEATRIMLHVHKNGRGMCGAFPEDIAEMKVLAVHKLARKHEFPLKSVMERE